VWQQFRLEAGAKFFSFVEVFPKSGEVPAIILCERLTLGWCPILFAKLQTSILEGKEKLWPQEMTI
jgi:hypothetical protein